MRKAAVQGVAEAQYNLGVCYSEGDGVKQDQREGASWYRKAAVQGVAAAQYYLGMCYLEGNGVAQDKQKAVVWFRKAAVQGHAVAQFYLGVWYLEGDGVAQDVEEGVNWCLKRAQKISHFLSAGTTVGHVVVSSVTRARPNGWRFPSSGTRARNAAVWQGQRTGFESFESAFEGGSLESHTN